MGASRFGQVFAVLSALIGGTFCAEAQTQALLLFGGDNHKTFLGCLNCTKYDSGSLCNKYGDSGSKYSQNSIWNRYGEFGSKYSAISPWNKYSDSAPVIVDRAGKFYGHLSANKYHSNRTRIKLFIQLAELVEAIDDLEKVRDLYCDDE